MFSLFFPHCLLLHFTFIPLFPFVCPFIPLFAPLYFIPFQSFYPSFFSSYSTIFFPAFSTRQPVKPPVDLHQNAKVQTLQSCTFLPFVQKFPALVQTSQTILFFPQQKFAFVPVTFL